MTYLSSLSQWLTKAYNEAKDKLSTLVGLLVASAGEIRENWRDVTDSIPQTKVTLFLEHHIFVILGLLVIYARIRRALKASST
jgi:phosphoheptose isomerase